MRKTLWLTAIAGLALLVQGERDSAAAQTRATLDIYVVDVEGGNATLFVAPSGESLLIDTGMSRQMRQFETPSVSWRPLKMPG